MITEYAAGIYTQPDGVSGSVASVTVKTVVPATSRTSGTCITSTIVSIDTTPGEAAHSRAITGPWVITPPNSGNDESPASLAGLS